MSDSLQKNTNGGYQQGSGNFQFSPNYAYKPDKKDSPGLDPRIILSIAYRYKWLVLTFLLIGVACGWLYTDITTPVYKSTGSLLISADIALIDEESKLISQTTGFGTSSTLYNELQVLQSRKFSRQIANRIVNEDTDGIEEYPVLWTREESGEIYPSGEETVAYRIRNNLDFRQPDDESDVVEISYHSPSPVEAATIVNMAMEIYVDNSTRQNRLAAESTAKFLEVEKQKLEQKLAESEETLRKYMDSTGIVKVDEQASDMVDQRADIMAELQSISLDLETIAQLKSNYEQQLERIKPGLSEQFAESIGPRIEQSQEELAKYESERTLILAKNPGVLNREQIPSRLKFLDEQIERLKTKIRNLSDQLFTQNDEYMGMDTEDRAKMVSDLQSRLVELRIEENQKKSRQNTLLQHKENVEAEFNSLPGGMMQLAKLQRDVKMNEDLFLNVSRQYAEIAVLKQSQFGYGRIIDRGEVPVVPVSPKRKIILLLGLMLGGFLSAGIIFVREFLDNTVKNVDQLKSIYLPTLTLSVIPTFPKISSKQKRLMDAEGGKVSKELVLMHDRLCTASEAISRLKNNIIYQHGDSPPKTIAVTSAEKGDGKSTLSSNLGIAFAEVGYKTLVIDCDLRQPRIQKIFGLNGNMGVTDFLNHELSLLKIVQNTDLKNLKVISSGNVVQHPDTVLGSNAFKHFLNRMKEVFDVIILDTPPYGIISDSTAILKLAEATLVVARYRKTNMGMLLRTVEELGQIQARIYSLVINNFNHQKEIDSGYYGSGYYHAYYNNYRNYVQ